jgi:hypothetical protein
VLISPDTNFTPAFRTAAAIPSASATSIARGFEATRCLPAPAAAMHTVALSLIRQAVATTSTSPACTAAV